MNDRLTQEHDDDSRGRLGMYALFLTLSFLGLCLGALIAVAVFLLTGVRR